MSDEQVKKHRKDLEIAINKALKTSPEITEAVRRIRTDGFEVFLIIEATIGLNRSSGSAEKTAGFQLTSHDHSFLRSLSIRPE